jgi:hypothetical protein
MNVDVADGHTGLRGPAGPHAYGTDQPMMGTLLMLFFGLPWMTRLL